MHPLRNIDRRYFGSEKSEIRKFFKNKLPENKTYEIHLDLDRLGITQKKTG